MQKSITTIATVGVCALVTALVLDYRSTRRAPLPLTMPAESLRGMIFDAPRSRIYLCATDQCTDA